MSDKCFCHFNGYQVKDATARRDIELLKNAITPEMYGAIGDGVTDDTAALQAVFATGKNVLLNGSYAITNGVTSDCKIVSGCGSIKLLNDVTTVFDLPNIENFSGISFDCNNHGVVNCIYTTAKNPIIKDVKIKNIYDLRVDNGSFGIFSYQAETVFIENISFVNCRHIANNQIGDTPGNISGIYASGYSVECIIKNCIFEEIHNIDNDGNIIFEDTNGIFIATSIKTATAYISNIRGVEYGKRLIKTQVCKAIIDGVYSYNSNSDHLNAISILGRFDDSITTDDIKVIISNCELTNDYNEAKNKQYLISFDSSTGIINNCKLNSLSQFCISELYNSKASIYNCTLNGNGCSGGNSTIHFYNCDFHSKNYFYFSTKNIMESIKLINCSLEVDDTKTQIYSQSFIISSNIAEFENCKINHTQSQIASGNFTFKNTEFLSKYYIEISAGANASFEDCKITAIATNINFIKILGTCKLLRTHFEGEFSYSIFSATGSTATLDLGDTELSNKFSLSLIPTVTNKAVLCPIIPTKGLYPDGVKFIYEEDGALYVKESGEWVKKWT